MAYTDTVSRPNPSSLGAAVAVNALLITGIIFAAPHVTGDAIEPPIILTSFFKADPVETKVEPRTKKPVDSKLTQPQAPLRPAASQSQSEGDNETITTGTGTETIGELLPPIEEKTVETPKPVLIFREATINPRFRAAFQPDYPPDLIRRQIQGAVTIRVLIGLDGRVSQVEPVRFDDPELLKVTRAHALRKWRFVPATRGGEPVESWRDMTVRFEIPN